MASSDSRGSLGDASEVEADEGICKESSTPGSSSGASCAWLSGCGGDGATPGDLGVVSLGIASCQVIE